jgi:DNA-binding transcriptional ArsR family regulator
MGDFCCCFLCKKSYNVDMEILGKVLGSPARVKIMRLFLLNKGKTFKSAEVVKRSRVVSDIVRRELKLLESVSFVKKLASGWVFNPVFKYSAEFKSLLIMSDTMNHETILNSFKKAGKVKLIVVSGIFIKNDDSRVDLLIVGDKLKKAKVEEGIRKLEAEIGAELVYAVFDTKEFMYRLDMYDKLVRDVLDYPHKVILQGKELSTEVLKGA